ncbi:MAG: hypothetical protein H7Y17_03590 [Chlorobia bacterium]|nr:hypothetical protein [Fimbriimonadaceae bacterium]
MKLKSLLVAGSLCLAGEASAQILPLPDKPRIGLRVSAGQWNRTMVGAGLDVTVKIPFVPIPALRFDAGLWGNPSDFGGGKRGNSISVMGIKNFPLIYAGLGPTFYFTSDDGDHNSGLGAKLLVGADIPGNYYIEGSIIVGPRPAAIFVSLGFKF